MDRRHNDGTHHHSARPPGRWLACLPPPLGAHLLVWWQALILFQAGSSAAAAGVAEASAPQDNSSAWVAPVLESLQAASAQQCGLLLVKDTRTPTPNVPNITAATAAPAAGGVGAGVRCCMVGTTCHCTSGCARSARAHAMNGVAQAHAPCLWPALLMRHHNLFIGKCLLLQAPAISVYCIALLLLQRWMPLGALDPQVVNLVNLVDHPRPHAPATPAPNLPASPASSPAMQPGAANSPGALSVTSHICPCITAGAGTRWRQRNIPAGQAGLAFATGEGGRKGALWT